MGDGEEGDNLADCPDLELLWKMTGINTTQISQQLLCVFNDAAAAELISVAAEKLGSDLMQQMCCLQILKQVVPVRQANICLSMYILHLHFGPKYKPIIHIYGRNHLQENRPLSW